MAATSSSSSTDVVDFDILKLLRSNEGDEVSNQPTKEGAEKQKDGPICQTLSYFDVIYPHLQIAYARRHLQQNGSTPSAEERRVAGSFCKMLFRQMNKNKRTRTSFTVDQLEGLEKYFRESQYVTSADRKMIADRLSLSETQVKIWYQNRRTKFKRVNLKGDNDE